MSFFQRIRGDQRKLPIYTLKTCLQKGYIKVKNGDDQAADDPLLSPYDPRGNGVLREESNHDLPAAPFIAIIVFHSRASSSGA